MEKVVSGILTLQGHESYLLDEEGGKHFQDDIIWDGYLTHWKGKKLLGRELPQKDYTTGRPIVILWPEPEYPEGPFVEIYFNERLVKYPASLLGHLAVNVNGEIFNFSHLINENEVIRYEEYFFRPALGEFAPHPVHKKYDSSDPGRPYYDKFGRNFMRTIHVLTIQGPDCATLSNYYHRELNVIHSAGGSAKSEKYRDFNLFTRNCATIIRDGLREAGFTGIGGIFPRDLFVNIAYALNKIAVTKPGSITIKQNIMNQLRVPEAPLSAMPPLISLCSRLRNRINYSGDSSFQG